MPGGQASRAIDPGVAEGAGGGRASFSLLTADEAVTRDESRRTRTAGGARLGGGGRAFPEKEKARPERDAARAPRNCEGTGLEKESTLPPLGRLAATPGRYNLYTRGSGRRPAKYARPACGCASGRKLGVSTARSRRRVVSALSAPLQLLRVPPAVSGLHFPPGRCLRRGDEPA